MILIKEQPTRMNEFLGCCGAVIIDQFDRKAETIKASTEQLLRQMHASVDVTYTNSYYDAPLDKNLDGTFIERTGVYRERGLVLWAGSPKIGPFPLKAYYEAGWECWGMWKSQYSETPMYLMALPFKSWVPPDEGTSLRYGVGVLNGKVSYDSSTNT